MSAAAKLALCGFLITAQLAASQSTPSPHESENVSAVWRREDDYIRAYKAGDVDAFLTLWHDKFIGWPCDEAHPTRKESVGGYVREIRDKHITMSADITREGAEDFGNVVVVHYRFAGVDTYPDGHVEGKGEQSKITHTWMRVGDKWVIIGGMCGALVRGF